MPYRILMLDDRPERVEEVRTVASQAGHELVSCRTVAGAMDWLNTKDHVDVIISGAFLENESVFDFLKAVKSDPRHSWVQFVMLCTEPGELALFMDDTVRNAARLLGADKYVMLPEFSPKRLLREIEASLPNMVPQVVQDPIRDALGHPRPVHEVPDSVEDAQ